MRDQLTREIFAQQLHTQFQVNRGAAHSAVAELVEASARPAPRGYEAFSIVFRGPPDALLQQGTHRFDHSAIGTFELFTVPIGQDQHGLYYEAIFSRRCEDA